MYLHGPQAIHVSPSLPKGNLCPDSPVDHPVCVPALYCLFLSRRVFIVFDLNFIMSHLYISVYR